MKDASRATPDPSSAPDGDGVRVTRIAPSRREVARGAALVAIVAAIAFGSWTMTAGVPAKASRAGTATQAGEVVQVDAKVESSASAPAAATSRDPSAPAVPPRARIAHVPEIGPDDLPGDDPNDLAAYISPDDPEPTMGEVIQALHDLGDRTGIGAFNPPGTSPPLRGIAVPPEFVLPPGYVRHHQVTDEGEPLEPILMFSPDYVFRDANGNEIAIPDNRVVPPELAPPGLPLRPITLPKP
jgi:hypothetical protein